jgi:putative heme-binding domain-containing protein
LVAAEPEIQKPVNLNFDAAGRLWVTGSELYPWPAAKDAAGNPIPEFQKIYSDIAAAFHATGKEPAPAAEGKDSIRIVSAFDAQGRAHKFEVFADKLNIASGIQPLPRPPGAKGDTAIVYSIPYIWRMEDTTGNGHADKRDILYGPFGFIDTHGGSSSYINWIDGWIYGTHGFRNHSEIKSRKGEVVTLDSGNTYRFRPDGSKFEFYDHGQTNPFGLAFDPLGNLYSADSHSKPVYLLLRGGYYEGIHKEHDGLGFAPWITTDDHGSSAIGGMVYYAAQQFPEEYRGNTFNGNVSTRIINRDRLDWTGATPKAVRQPDFLTCDDPWFHPVNIKLGPDGALWIADFYNCVIGHYEFPLADPRRDHTHGRIWRVVYRGEKKEETPAAPANLTQLSAAALVEKLGDPNVEVKRLATLEAINRGAQAMGPVLTDLLNDPKRGTPAQRAYALWAARELGLKDSEAVKQALDSQDTLARTQALRLLDTQTPWNSGSDEAARHALTDPEAQVRLVATVALAQHPSPGNLEPLLNLWKETPADDAELVYATRVSLRDNLTAPGVYPAAQKIAESNPAAGQRLAEISVAVPTADAADFLLAQLKRANLATPRAGEFLKHVALNVAPEKLPAVIDFVEHLHDAPLPQRFAVAQGLSEAAARRGLQLPESTRAWTEHTIIEALGSTDGAILDHALEAARELKTPEKLEPLRRLATGNGPYTRRNAALDALVNLDNAAPVLVTALNDHSDLRVQKKAAEDLGTLKAPEARAALLKMLPVAPWELGTSIAGSLARTDGGGEQLVALVESGKAPPALLRNNAVAGPLSGRSPAIRDWVTALTKDLPPEDARLDQVIAARVEGFRKVKSDPAHGVTVFQQTCAVCHKLKNQGGNVGPNLDGIAERGIARIFEDILDPNRNVDPAFAQTIIESTDGETFVGVGAHPDGELVVMSGADGKPVTVPKAKVKSQTVTRLSLMPPGFEQAIPVQDLNDIVAYLLKATGGGNP